MRRRDLSARAVRFFSSAAPVVSAAATVAIAVVSYVGFRDLVEQRQVENKLLVRKELMPLLSFSDVTVQENESGSPEIAILWTSKSSQIATISPVGVRFFYCSAEPYRTEFVGEYSIGEIDLRDGVTIPPFGERTIYTSPSIYYGRRWSEARREFSGKTLIVEYNFVAYLQDVYDFEEYIYENGLERRSRPFDDAAVVEWPPVFSNYFVLQAFSFDVDGNAAATDESCMDGMRQLMGLNSRGG